VQAESTPVEAGYTLVKVESNPGEVDYTLVEVEYTLVEVEYTLVEAGCTPAEGGTPVEDLVQIVEGWEKQGVPDSHTRLWAQLCSTMVQG